MTGSSWFVDKWLVYFILAVTGSLTVRCLSSLLKSIDVSTNSSAIQLPTFWVRLRQHFCGYGAIQDENNDYWHPFVLGVLELLALPILMSTGLWTLVGGWVAFKGLTQWRFWTERRSPFNRFLICNMAMLLWGLLVMTQHVHVPTVPPKAAQPAAAADR